MINFHFQKWISFGRVLLLKFKELQGHIVFTNAFKVEVFSKIKSGVFLLAFIVSLQLPVGYVLFNAIDLPLCM